jgi:acylphosphatase
MASRLLLALGLAMFGVTLGPAGPAAAATELLPDLKMSIPYNLQLQPGRGGNLRLRFGTIVWNVGDGPLEVRADGREGRHMRNLVQWIALRNGGGATYAPPGASAFYSGDGHDHWHIKTFIVIGLFARDGSSTTGDASPTYSQRGLRKIGFCLTDLVRAPASLRPANAASRIRYPVAGCGTRESTSVRMGISPGYGDDYKPFFNQQLIDISGLEAGVYRMCATVNGSGMWREKDDNLTNNSSWVDIELDPDRRSFRVVDSGESDCERPEPVWYGVGS